MLYGAAKKFRASPLAQVYSAAGLELASVYGGVEQVDAALEDGEGLPREAIDSAHRAMQRSTALVERPSSGSSVPLSAS